MYAATWKPGEALGRAVAQKFVTRARGDRAGAAVGTQAIWSQMENDCIARGETPWLSLELPKRPPMLPVFGKVKGFLVDSLTCIALRPGPPPATGSEKMKKELEEVYNFAKAPTSEQIRIVHYWADGVGTTHRPALERHCRRRLYWKELQRSSVGTQYGPAEHVADGCLHCVLGNKIFYFNPRPSQLNPAIKTTTGIPNFPAYISGHSTFQRYGGYGAWAHFTRTGKSLPVHGRGSVHVPVVRRHSLP
jgi:hypothetical protein